jgi:hypothetical protein
VCDVLAIASGSTSGITVERRIAHLWKLREGRVRRWFVYTTLREALEAAGLRSSSGVAAIPAPVQRGTVLVGSPLQCGSTGDCRWSG